MHHQHEHQPQTHGEKSPLGCWETSRPSPIFKNSSVHCDRSAAFDKVLHPGKLNADFSFNSSPFPVDTRRTQQNSVSHERLRREYYLACSARAFTEARCMERPMQSHSRAFDSCKHIARQYVRNVCPFVGAKLYCVPPIDRYGYPEKKTKLSNRLESRNRVLSSFESFFAQHNMPVFMICHYKLTGFLNKLEDFGPPCNGQLYHKNDTVTAIMVARTFDVIVVLVKVVDDKSGYIYIREEVRHAQSLAEEYASTVSQWLTFLRVPYRVKVVMAFPNLRKSAMEKAVGSNRMDCESSLYSYRTLNLNDLPGPFTEDLSTPVQKCSFSKWIDENILQNMGGLSQSDMVMVVGTMLCPRLSDVEYNTTLSTIEPVDDSDKDKEVKPTQGASEGIGQLKLTIDGVTHRLDEFVDDFMFMYFPNLTTQTYRVPPIHFNMQLFKKASEVITVPREENSGDQVMTESVPVSGMSPLCSENSDPPKISSECPTSNPVDRSVTSNHMLLKALEDVDVMYPAMAKDIRADEGENRVVTAFEMLGEVCEPMFIISGYKYNNYLNKLREEMFSKWETARPSRAFGQMMRAEHDCLIFNKGLGAIVVCIKAVGDNFSKWGATDKEKINAINKVLAKAIKQLEREKTVFQNVTSDFGKATLACHKLIALPNLRRKDVADALNHDQALKEEINALTGGLGVQMFLCQDELPIQFESVWDPPEPDTHNLFSKWWKHFRDVLSQKGQAMSEHLFRQVVGRFVGLLSTVEVWTQGAPRIEVRSMSEAVQLGAERFAKLVLLPRQVKILASSFPYIFLYGPPGSGKTLMLTLKAREWLLTGHAVFVLNVRALSEIGYPFAYGVEQRLKAMVPMGKLQRYDVDPLNYDPSMLKDITQSSYIIIDEVTPASHEVIHHLCSLGVRSIWCAGQFQLDSPYKESSTYALTEIIRCPPIVQNVLRQVEENVRPAVPYINFYASLDALADLNKKKMTPSLEEKIKSSSETDMTMEELQEALSESEEQIVTSISKVKVGQATDGPRPHIIDHQRHTGPREPQDCYKCGQELAEYLHNVIKFGRAWKPAAKSRQSPLTKNFFDSSSKAWGRKRIGSYSQILTDNEVGTQVRNDYKILSWSDVLMVSKEVSEKCSMVHALMKHNIPVEVVQGASSSRIELPRGEKVVLTTPKEICGIERAVVIFIPSSTPDGLHHGVTKDAKSSQWSDLHLMNSISRFTEHDKELLWYTASRSLCSLVLVLP